jgi:hypothetical protein
MHMGRSLESGDLISIEIRRMWHRSRRGCTNLEELGALGHIAFRYTDSVGTQNQFSIAAQWLACAFPCRRFADTLADAYARLGADVDCYSFVVVDLHHLLLAGLPAHLCENPI